MTNDWGLRRGLLQAELEENHRLEVRLKLQELELMQRRKEITTKLVNGDEVEAPPLHIL